MSVSIPDLYDYVTNSGIVVPDVSEIKANVTSMVKSIFGDNVIVDDSTPMGRLIEAFTASFRTFLEVNAQNANQFNLNYATGIYLDSIGTLFNITRANGENDNAFRSRIKRSRFTGRSFADSCYSAIMDLKDEDGAQLVKSAVVLENGYGMSKMMNSISVSPHSIFVCVDAEDEDLGEIAKAILNTKTAGCGYTMSGTVSDSTLHTVSVSGLHGNYTVYLFTPGTLRAAIGVTVRNLSYTGSDISDDITDAVHKYLDQSGIGSYISPESMSSAITNSVQGIEVLSVTINGSSSPITLSGDQKFDPSSITVTVSA